MFYLQGSFVLLWLEFGRCFAVVNVYSAPWLGHFDGKWCLNMETTWQRDVFVGSVYYSCEQQDLYLILQHIKLISFNFQFNITDSQSSPAPFPNLGDKPTHTTDFTFDHVLHL